MIHRSRPEQELQSGRLRVHCVARPKMWQGRRCGKAEGVASLVPAAGGKAFPDVEGRRANHGTGRGQFRNLFSYNRLRLGISPGGTRARTDRPIRIISQRYFPRTV